MSLSKVILEQWTHLLHDYLPVSAVDEPRQARTCNAGEEEESVVFECKARAFKLATGWQLQGTGVLRLLQHPGTNRARIVLRTDPGGNVILNTFLKKDLDYSRQGNSVQFMVPQADKAQPEHWTVRVNAQSIEKLHPKMQEIKN